MRHIKLVFCLLLATIIGFFVMIYVGIGAFAVCVKKYIKDQLFSSYKDIIEEYKNES